MTTDLNLLTSAFDSIGAASGVVYLTVPLGSGRREISLLERLQCSRETLHTDHLDTWRQDVLRRDVDDANRIEEQVRACFPGRLVLNPAPVAHHWLLSAASDPWPELVRRYADIVVAASGWEFSPRCRREIGAALAASVPVVHPNGDPLEPSLVASLDRAATASVANSRLLPADRATYLEPIPELGAPRPHVALSDAGAEQFKDAVLDQLARRANVAQFISLGPGDPPRLRFHRIRGTDSGGSFQSWTDAVTALVKQSPSGHVNVRSFQPPVSKSLEFIYRLNDVEVVLAHVRRLTGAGLHAIVNEQIDVNDGGVSGVAQGALVEFSPDDNTRCVDRPGTMALERGLACALLRRVYGRGPSLDFPPTYRVEFSLHPMRQGLRDDHTVIWEAEHSGYAPPPPAILWPNNFSRLMGDKALGLLVSSELGLPVPRTIAIGRRLAPFAFGQSTGTDEVWIRTCPPEPVPGKYRTNFGWLDPFRLMEQEDPSGTQISAVLVQEAVDPVSSGAFVADADGRMVNQGVAGRGDQFMVGAAAPQQLDERVVSAVTSLQRDVSAAFGPVKVEWVYDGSQAWLVQVNRLHGPVGDRTIVPGEPARYQRFDVTRGLEALRELISDVRARGDGIVLEGDVGVTSHFGDVLRQAGVPSKIEARAAQG